MRPDRLLRRAGKAVAVAAIVIWSAFPIAFIVVSSFKPGRDIFAVPPRFVFDPTAAHYVNLWNRWGGFFDGLLNSLIVCVGILVVQLVTAIPAAYALAKLKFRGSTILFGTVVASLTIPINVTSIPIYIGIVKVGLLDTHVAMMFPFFISVFAIFLFRQFFRTFPDSIIQAARIDGFSEMEIVLRLILPSAVPAIAAFSVFSFVAHWNDLYWPLIVVTSSERATPALGILAFRDAETGGNYGALMAAAALITGPMIVGFLVARRAFVRGITMTGVR